MAWTLVGLFMSLSCWIWDAVVSYVLPSLSASSREKPGPLLSSFFWKSRALQLVMISSSKCLFDSAGVMVHFNTCSLHQLTKSCSNSWGPWRYAISFSRAILKFSTGSSCSLNLSKIVTGICCSSDRAHEMKCLSPSSPTWRRMWAVCSASGIFFAVKYSCSLWEKSWKLLAWLAVDQYHGSVVHFARISIRLLPRGQDFGSLLCSLI